MIGASPSLKVPRESVRALVEGISEDSCERVCTVCGNPLRPRQQVCSGRCRAELTRRRQAEARQARDQEVRALLLAALDLIGKDGQP
jgi:predicted nucleic acid-binding Zn ribbon protein